MKRLLLKVNEHNKISSAPGNNASIGRREPVTIQMVPHIKVNPPPIKIDNYVRPHPYIPSTPISFWPQRNESLKDRMLYVQKELFKIQQERKHEEKKTFAYYSRVSDEELEPYINLMHELHFDKDVDLGEPAIPLNQQQRDLGSLNDRNAKNRKPQVACQNVVSEPIKARKKGGYSRWSE